MVSRKFFSDTRFRQFRIVVIWTATTLVIGVKRQRIIYIVIYSIISYFSWLYIVNSPLQFPV